VPKASTFGKSLYSNDCRSSETLRYGRSAAVPAAGLRSVPLRKFRAGLDSRGVTPLKPAGEDARATFFPGEDGGGVKLRLSPHPIWQAGSVAFD
jgi:hypothetical protein